MFDVSVKTVPEFKKVEESAHKAAFKNLAHAGAAIRKTARELIHNSPDPSPPGTPPHTRRGLLRDSILYHITESKEGIVIGPVYSIVGPASIPHEFGGEFRGRHYDARPFMGPALTANLSRLAPQWEGTIGPS